MRAEGHGGIPRAWQNPQGTAGHGTWMSSECAMLLLASRQLDTITSGNSDCWGTEAQQRPLGCSGCL